MPAYADLIARLHIEIATDDASGDVRVTVTDERTCDYSFVVRIQDFMAVADALRKEAATNPDRYPLGMARRVGGPPALERR